MIFLHPLRLLLLLSLPLVFFAYYQAACRAARWRSTWNRPERQFLFLRPLIQCLILGLVFIALARPVWDPEEQKTSHQGQNTVFLVDVSRSMETRDLKDLSRLDAVKQALLDLIPDLEGDKTALVAFAGTTVVTSPLTADRSFFRSAVQALGPLSTSRGGTLLGDALRRISRDFQSSQAPLALWVFTDGGDQESFPLEAAKDLAQKNISLHIWGVGSLQGGVVPDRQISSVLEEDLLRQMAAAVPEGQYFGPETELWQLNQKYTQSRKNGHLESSSSLIWQEGAWWLLWPCFVLMLLDLGLSLWYKQHEDTTKPQSSPKKKKKRLLGFLPLGLVLLLLASSCSPADKDPWPQPATEEAFKNLEEKLKDPHISTDAKAQLFYLWGQELAQKALNPGTADQEDKGKNLHRAIGAFTKVLDFHGPLSDESRHNLEILWRFEQDQNQESSQNQDKSKDSQDSQNDSSSKQDQNSQDKNSNQDGKDQQSKDQNTQAQNNDSQNSQEGTQESGDSKEARQNQEQNDQAQEARDLSGFVREKEAQSDLDKALEQENLRQVQKKTQTPGTPIPVDKDW